MFTYIVMGVKNADMYINGIFGIISISLGGIYSFAVMFVPTGVPAGELWPLLMGRSGTLVLTLIVAGVLFKMLKHAYDRIQKLHDSRLEDLKKSHSDIIAEMEKSHEIILKEKDDRIDSMKKQIGPSS